MRNLVIVAALACVVGCGGGSSGAPAAPTAPAAPSGPAGSAEIVSADSQLRLACSYTVTPHSCSLSGDIKNVGTGCAIGISGTLHLYNAALAEVGQHRWQLEPSRILKASETAAYAISAVPLSQLDTGGTYKLRDIAWTNTRCP